MLEILSFLVLLYIIAIFGVIALSWFTVQPGSPLHQVFLFLRRLTEPVLGPVRRLIPPVGGVLDLSPTIVIFLLILLRGVLAGAA